MIFLKFYIVIALLLVAIGVISTVAGNRKENDFYDFLLVVVASFLWLPALGIMWWNEFDGKY